MAFREADSISAEKHLRTQKTPSWTRLKQGDKVLVTGSSWPVSWDYRERKQYIQNIRDLIENKLGLVAVIPDALLDEPFNEHYVHDTKHRAEMDMLATKDSDIKMIWNLHGGYGALESGRVFDQWRKNNPDALKNGIPEIGFSDVTVKLLRKGQAYSQVNSKGELDNISGIISPIHGPTLMHMVEKPFGNTPERNKSIEKYIETFKKLFMEAQEQDKARLEDDAIRFKLRPLNSAANAPGLVFKGETLGGHTSRVVTSLGTHWEIAKNHTGKNNDKIILAIESDDTPELEEFLEHISQTAAWPKISAIAIGCVVPLEQRFVKRNDHEFYDADTQEKIETLAAKYDKPIFAELPIGHTLENAFLPMLTESSITVEPSGDRASLKVDLFRTKENIKKTHTLFDPSPDKRFIHSRRLSKQSTLPSETLSLINNVKLTPLNLKAKICPPQQTLDIIGGDIAIEQKNLGTPKQLNANGKTLFFHTDLRHPSTILTLAGDDATDPHFSPLVKANIVRYLAHMNEAGVFKGAQAIIIGDIVPPSNLSDKSFRYIKYFNKEIEIFLKENDITIPVYRAVGHQLLPQQFHIENARMQCTGVDNTLTLSTDLKIQNQLTPARNYLGAA